MRKTFINEGQYPRVPMPSCFPQVANSETVAQGFSESPGELEPWLPSVMTNLQLHHVLALPLPFHASWSTTPWSLGWLPEINCLNTSPCLKLYAFDRSDYETSGLGRQTLRVRFWNWFIHHTHWDKDPIIVAADTCWHGSYIIAITEANTRV